MTRKNRKMHKTIATTSGTLYFLNQRNIGNKSTAIKNAISNGMITLCPNTIINPSAHKPNNSIDLLTVKGIYFMCTDYSGDL
jgi:hypothetical protein